MSMIAKLGLEGKTVLVVGGGGLINNQGIGPSTCRLFAEAGANVVAVDIKKERAEAIAAEVRCLGQRAIAISADILSEDDITRMVETSVAEFGGVDVLVNVVGRPLFVPALEMKRAQWDEQIDTNLTYVWLCSKTVAKTMIAQGRRGSIISVSSAGGMNADTQHFAYGAAKAGLIGMTRTLAVEWAPYNIRVNSVAPGWTGTPKALRQIEKQPGLRKRLEQAIPLVRIGTPDDIAGAILWLASDLASYVTGHTIPVDGGLLLNNISMLRITED
ncbi:MAG: SDR family oxidoreductase [Dehalococcoidia bacterium]